jgi:ATP-binding cassette, subfamily F, member 3
MRRFLPSNVFITLAFFNPQMISINNLSIAYNGIPLLDSISFTVNPKDKIGLTGKNGAGKSTLLKIIAGLQEYDSGIVSMPKDTTTGYLPQQMKYPEGKSVIDETLTVFSEILGLRDEIEMLHQRIASFKEYTDKEYLLMVHKMTELEDQFTHSGGNTLRAEAEKTLKGLGFTGEDFDRDVSEFSGGWRMRIELAKILLLKPSILLLDEPTNHLDIESIEWLEQLLMNYGGSVILISHDRLFLDNITKRTIEIVKSKIYDYKVPYSRFEELRKERIEQNESAFRNQQKQIQETEKFIERFRYKATKAVQVQSRIKQLDKIERIEIEETDISNLKFKFPEAPSSGEVVFEIKDLSKSYTDQNVLENIWLNIERGQKIAFVGKNGQGKTTLVRIIKGELEYEGTLKIGHQVKIGYFAQNQDKLLDEQKTVFETLDDIAKGDIRMRIRDILGNFLFSGEDIDKKVQVLSGGERSRLALAKLMLEPNNVLILDEPTNHLDIRSKDMLKRALSLFKGTLILVSHDRFFLDGLVDEIYEFIDKNIKKHSGDINEFLIKKRSEFQNSVIKTNTTIQQQEQEKVQSEQKDIYFRRRELDKEIRKLNKKLDETETAIHENESYIRNAENQILTDEVVHDSNFYIEFEKVKKNLELLLVRWEDISYSIDELKKQKDAEK